MVNVFFTVDTECSMGGAWENPSHKPVHPERSVLGKIGPVYYGIPRIMDILEENDLHGTFFVEVFAALGDFRNDLADAYKEIVRRGHDVQLHLHPIHYFYRAVQQGRLLPKQLPPEKDMIGTFPISLQLQLLQTGVELFRQLVGKAPMAFRAGNFGASSSTLDVLEKVGIRFDSSFNAAYVNVGCTIASHGAINGLWPHSGVWEVPITTFETGLWKFRGLKPLNINAISLWEMKNVLEQADRIGLSAVTFIAHSFSLFKIADFQFHRPRADKLVLRRFEGLCRFLREQRHRFRVVGFSDIQPSWLQIGEAGVPNAGAFVPVLRKAVQAINRIHWF
jgi:peptidoglycan/xylan/chitin deacetylase (PgdA/CDA1 family)